MKIENKACKIKARDGMSLDGDYYFNKKGKKEKIFIIFPGLTSMTQQYTYLRLRDIMVESGYNVFIINSYSSEEVLGAFPRSLCEITMKRHVEDFEDIVDHFKNIYDKVYACGHSIGGRILISSNNRHLLGQVLLDPSGDFSNDDYLELLGSNFKISEKWGCKYIDWDDGIFYPVGEVGCELRDSCFEEVKKCVKNLTVPTLFVAAGAFDYSKIYKKYINNICKHIEIKDSCHEFSNYGDMEIVANEILDFFKAI